MSWVFLTIFSEIYSENQEHDIELKDLKTCHVIRKGVHWVGIKGFECVVVEEISIIKKIQSTLYLEIGKICWVRLGHWLDSMHLKVKDINVQTHLIDVSLRRDLWHILLPYGHIKKCLPAFSHPINQSQSKSWSHWAQLLLMLAEDLNIIHSVCALVLHTYRMQNF